MFFETPKEVQDMKKAQRNSAPAQQQQQGGQQAPATGK
jgi:hypothetical protein